MHRQVHHRPPHGVLQHHHHHVVHLFRLCPCSCHRGHYHQFPSHCLGFPPPLGNPRPSCIPSHTFSQVLPNNPSPGPHVPRHDGLESSASAMEVKVADVPPVLTKEQEWYDNRVIDDDEDDEDDDMVFVLTDEWREFFAKSEAKRKLAKQKQQKEKDGSSINGQN